MIELDGSFEEGGGQILRTALGLSVITKKPFHITKIRQEREKSGLKKQHIEAIKALKILCNAEVSQFEIGSEELTFDPGIFKPQKLEIDIETAGSITLLLQSLLAPMLLADKKTILTIKGGTDVEGAVQADYMKYVILPHLAKYADIEFKIIKRGYYPKGQGVIEISVSPKKMQQNGRQIILANQNELLAVKGIVHCSKNLQKRTVAERIAYNAQMNLQKLSCPVNIETLYVDAESDGCGIVLWSLHGKEEVDSLNPIILGSDKLGKLHVPAEDVGKQCAKRLIEEIESGAAADEHLADNLVPFLGLFGGRIKTSEITKHILSNIYAAEKFLDVRFDINPKTKEISVVKPYLAQYQS